MVSGGIRQGEKRVGKKGEFAWVFKVV
jgi:hypothetical protein